MDEETEAPRGPVSDFPKTTQLVSGRGRIGEQAWPHRRFRSHPRAPWAPSEGWEPRGEGTRFTLPQTGVCSVLSWLILDNLRTPRTSSGLASPRPAHHSLPASCTDWFHKCAASPCVRRWHHADAGPQQLIKPSPAIVGLPFLGEGA